MNKEEKMRGSPSKFVRGIWWATGGISTLVTLYTRSSTVVFGGVILGMAVMAHYWAIWAEKEGGACP